MADLRGCGGTGLPEGLGEEAKPSIQARNSCRSKPQPVSSLNSCLSARAKVRGDLVVAQSGGG